MDVQTLNYPIARKEGRTNHDWLPPGYMLDKSDPDIRIVRRTDGSFVAAFSARGASRESILEAAEEDRRRHEQE